MKTSTVWVYAENAEDALRRATGEDLYDPWPSRESAERDRGNPIAVLAGERMYRVTTSVVVDAVEVER